MSTSHLHPGLRRSARLRSQIHATEDGAEVASHSRSTRRSTQIQESEGGDRVTRRRRGNGLRLVGDGTSLEQPASPLEVDDLLREILLRLPLDLHSLSRASAVCKPWRGIVVDPNSPSSSASSIHAIVSRPSSDSSSTPTIRSSSPPSCPPAPDRILPRSFSCSNNFADITLLDSRHGRVLLEDHYLLTKRKIVVYDPITSKQHAVSIPPEFMHHHFSAAVLCVASDQEHVHGDCHSYPFKVVLVSTYREGQPVAYVYSSETATWGGIISTEAPHNRSTLEGPDTLVGSVLYWPLHTKGGFTILEFDLDTQNLAVIKGPPNVNRIRLGDFHITEAADGAVGLAVVSRLKLLMWQRKIDCQGNPIWLLQKTVTWCKLLKITKPRLWVQLVGYDEDNDVILLAIYNDFYMVQPKSMQARKLNGSRFTDRCHTFTSFYPLGTAINCQWN